jgi:hypothetical protein
VSLSADQIQALLEVRTGKTLGDIRHTKFFKHERDNLVFKGYVRFAGGWVLTPQGRAALREAGLREAGYGDARRSKHARRPARASRRSRLQQLSQFGNVLVSAFDRAPALVQRNVVLDVQEMARFELKKIITFDEAKSIARVLGQRSIKSLYYVSMRRLRGLIENVSSYAAYGNAIRVRLPGGEKTVLDAHTGKQVHAIGGAIRRTVRKRKAEEIRRVRRMLAKATPGSRDDESLRAYMAVLLRKAGGTGKRYVPDEKALPGWRDVPDYKRTRSR